MCSKKKKNDYTTSVNYYLLALFLWILSYNKGSSMHAIIHWGDPAGWGYQIRTSG